MTRDELASRLAQSEGELAVLGDREKGILVRLRQDAETLEELRGERDKLQGARDDALKQRDETQQELDRVRNHKNEQEAELSRAREQLRQQDNAQEAARTRIAELEARLKALHQNAQPPEPPRPNRHSLGAEL
jgi:chromosome segregation ATPase